MLTVLVLVGAFVWLTIFIAPWRPWSTSEVIHAAPGEKMEDLSAVTVLIPARNEAEVIATTLAGLAVQGDGLKVVLVDDQSTDGTSRIAQETVGIDLLVVQGETPSFGMEREALGIKPGAGTCAYRSGAPPGRGYRTETGSAFRPQDKDAEEGAAFVSVMASFE